MIEEKVCVVCGFDKRVNKHHLQKYVDYGTNLDCNLVYLCPNHHWIADFGDEVDKEALLHIIEQITGKKPTIDYDKKEWMDKIIRAYMEDRLGYDEGFSEEEWKKQKDSWDYNFLKKTLNSRPGSSEYNSRRNLIEECEIKYIIKFLRMRLRQN